MTKMADLNMRDRNDLIPSSLFNVKYDLAQNIISYESPSSLEQLTVIKIAIFLWQCDENRDDIVFSISSGISIDRFHKQKLPPFPRIFKKISLLQLPKFCEDAVKEMIKSIGVQIFKFLTSQNQLNFSVPEKIKLYWDNIRWTRQGTINSLKTSSCLVEQSNLDIIEKYIISCNNCLKENILNLLKKLSDDVINNFAKEDAFRLVTFWTCHIRGEHEKFSGIVRRGYSPEISSNRYIFDWAIRNKKEVAVQYLWENFADEEIKEHLMYYARDSMGRTRFSDYERYINISCYLLSQMNQAQVEELCVVKGYAVLSLLSHKSGRWRYLLVRTANYVLKFFSKMNMWDALAIVKICWREYLFDREYYVNVLKDFLIIFRNDVKRDFMKISEDLLEPLFLRENVESIKLFLSTGSAQDRKNVLYDYSVMKQCEELITIGKLDLLDLFIREILIVEEEIDKFKKYFFETFGFNICFSLVLGDSYQILSAFLIMFYIEEDLRTWQANLPYKENAKIIAYIMKWTSKKDTLQLIKIDKFLGWCFEGIEDEIIRCKAKIFDPEREEYSDCNDRILKRVSVLIKEGDWLLAEEYMKWTFLTEDKVQIFKKNLACNKEISVKLMYELILRGDNLKSFKKFVTFLPQGEVAKLKEEMRENRKLLTVVKELLRRQKFKEVDDLLGWWFLSAEDNVKFRKLLVP